MEVSRRELLAGAAGAAVAATGAGVGASIAAAGHTPSTTGGCACEETVRELPIVR